MLIRPPVGAIPRIRPDYRGGGQATSANAEKDEKDEKIEKAENIENVEKGEKVQTAPDGNRGPWDVAI
jgi:hypothetical protein